MSDIRFNQWLHQSGTGGVSQVASGAVGVGTTNPLADFYVRGDAQITGILTAGHIAMGSSITFGDNDRIYMGDGDDLSIYHSGAHSFIEDTGQGNLVLKGNRIDIQDNSGNALLLAEGGQYVRLNYGANERLQTTGYGVTVYGTVNGKGLVNSGVSTLTGNVITSADVSFSGSSYNATWITAGDKLRLMIMLVQHSVLKMTYKYIIIIHQLYIRNTSGNLRIQPKAGEQGYYIKT